MREFEVASNNPTFQHEYSATSKRQHVWSQRLVLRWVLNVVNKEDLNRGSARYKLKAILLRQGLHKGWTLGIGRRCMAFAFVYEFHNPVEGPR